MGLVLDTSTLVDLERAGHPPGSPALPDESTVFVPAIVVAELYVGVELARDPKSRQKREARVEALLDHVTVLDFHLGIARIYASLYADLRARGTPIPQNDLAVAATALYHQHALLVGRHDEAHFRGVPGLEVRVL